MKIALLGNPNTGKSSIFNTLTGLRQHIGNFPGVTVDKKVGAIQGTKHTLIDFPGTYSIYPHSADEAVVYNVLTNPNHEDYPNKIAVIVDATNMRRNLLLFTQMYDLGLPTILIINMIDLAERKSLQIDLKELERLFPETEIVLCNARLKMGKDRIIEAFEGAKRETKNRIYSPELASLDDKDTQELEAEQRFKWIDENINKIVTTKHTMQSTKSYRIDKVLTHPIWGYTIFALVLFLIFQFIFSFASVPMDFIDAQFGLLSEFVEEQMSEGILRDLITQGIIPGIGGVIIFIPQIAILFFFLAILEGSGYMARVVFIMDRLMRPFGLNGKSVVPLMSSVACAIPGVMAARTISNWKERLTTILVAPLMSCSARIPVYALLISLVVPEYKILGLFNVQGLVLLGLYILGLVAALLIAALLKKTIKSTNKGHLLLEMPAYKLPQWSNVGMTVFEKVKTFVVDAGKIILAIAIVIWALSSYGPSKRMDKAIELAELKIVQEDLNDDEAIELINGEKLRNSYIGIMGKAIEPVIQPLGYDWKIGISLISSFAAREVFVGTLATIYAVEDDGEENLALREHLNRDTRDDGTKLYTFATGMSLMVFYAFAMQCMATLAVVKRETNSWKWPLFQLVFLGALAYISAFITYQILS